MIKGISTLALIFLVQLLVGQDVLIYEGPYEAGEAVYEYTETDLHQRIFNGKFTYTEIRDIPERGGENEILITGTFKADKKHLVWAVTVKSEADSGLTETIIGNYLDGSKSGLWTQRIRRNADDSELKFAQASFIKNHFRGPFKYKYDRPDAQGIKAVEVSGSFDAKGLLDGEWKITYTDGTDTPFEDVMRFRHGVLAFRMFKNLADGKVLESHDNEKFVTSFFTNMDKVDSSSVVDGEKFGIRSGLKTEHRFLVPLFEAWTNLKKVDVGLNYDSSIPTMLMRKGEIYNANSLNNRAEIIDWKDTPEGKRELEEQQAIQKAYDTKINVADLQFNQENFRQALPLYKEAYQIKKEPYAKDQIALVEERIKAEEEKKQLFTIVKARFDLWKGNDRMLKDENYYGKKKHLMEGAMIALAYIKKDIESRYDETIAFVYRDAYDQLTMDQLRSFQADIDRAISFQDKLKTVAKKEDTKDLEKEIKKMEDPKQIIEAVLNS